MIHRPNPNEYYSYYGSYISLVPDGEITVLLKNQLDESLRLLEPLKEEQGDYRYAPGKWTLKEVVGHISDNERIMSYRLLCVAYGDPTPLPGYDQDLYMRSQPFRNCTLPEVIDEFKTVRQTTLSLIERLPESGFQTIGNVNGSAMSAIALAYIIAGHELHHRQIIRERYLHG